MQRESLVIRSERRGGTATRHARRMESLHALARRQLAAARLGARAIGFAPEEAPAGAAAARAPVVVERAALRRPRADGGGDRPALEALLSPFTVEEFFRAQETRAQPVLLRGEAARFAELVRWPDLDALLASGKLDATSVRMVVDGTELAPILHAATMLGAGGHRRDADAGRVDGRKVRALVAEGATLVIDEADRHLDVVSALAEAFETALATWCRVNLYASWRTTRGFETHWDDHDVFVVQVQGEKIWRVLGPTRVWPTQDDTVLDEAPPETPLWTGRITAGDLLYIPRGWWHDAHVPPGCDGRGSIHLTCQVRTLTGQDVLAWLGEWLQPETLFRRPVPIWAGEEAFAGYLAQMKGLIGAMLDRADAGRIAGELRARWIERSAPGLGAWVEPWKDPEWPRYRLRLLGRAHATCTEEGETLRLAANGRTHTLQARAREVVGALMETGEVAVETVREAGAAGGAEPEAVEALLVLWVRRGVLHASAPHDRGGAAV